jgi:hypothetical protein
MLNKIMSSVVTSSRKKKTKTKSCEKERNRDTGFSDTDSYDDKPRKNVFRSSGEHSTGSHGIGRDSRKSDAVPIQSSINARKPTSSSLARAEGVSIRYFFFQNEKITQFEVQSLLNSISHT